MARVVAAVAQCVVPSAVVSTLLLACAPALAQPIALQVGTTGAGAEFGVGLNDYAAVRTSFGAASVPYSFTESGIRYDARAKPRFALLSFDLHPFAGVFRLSAGVAYNGTKVEGTADTTSGTIVLNGVTYNTTDIGTVQGEVHFRKVAPYLGFGWGASARATAGFFATADFGALYSPATGSVTGSCAPFLPPPVCATLQSDLRAEADAFRREVESYKFYPVVRLGVGYRF